MHRLFPHTSSHHICWVVTVLLLVFLIAGVPFVFSQPTSASQTLPTQPFREQPIHLDAHFFTQEKMSIGLNMAYLEDTGDTLTVSDVRSPLIADRFTPSTQRSPNFGPIAHRYWLRWTIANTPLARTPLILDIGIKDSIVVFTQMPDASFRASASGHLVPFEQREIPTARAAFLLRLDTNAASTTFYLLIIPGLSGSPMNANLYTIPAFMRKVEREMQWADFVYALLFLMFCYNLILWRSRRGIYGYYCAYVAALLLTLWGLEGNDARIFTANWLFSLTSFVSFLAYSLAVLFAQKLLQSKRTTPRMHKVASLMAVLLISIASANAIVTALYGVPNIPLQILTALVSLSISAIGSMIFFLNWRQGVLPMRYILIGWIAQIFGGTCVILGVWNFVPFDEFWNFGILYASSAIEVVCFSLALAEHTLFLETQIMDAPRPQNITVKNTAQTLGSYNEFRQYILDLASKRLETEQRAERAEEQEVSLLHLNMIATELQEQARTLREQKQQLEERNNEKSEIMGIVAHDLRNPITAVSGLASMLQDDELPEERRKEVLEQISAAADRMSGLVTNVLESYRMEQGEMRVQSEVVLFEILAVETVRLYEERAAKKNITIGFEKTSSADDAVFQVLADETLLKQVLDNLLSNAVKYSPHGKNVYVRVLSRAEAVRIEVQDEGEGISAEDMKRLFGKFARLSARPTGGEHSTGLGLSIVKKMVEAMNGRVWCESEAGKGATFIVEFPLIS